MSIANRFKKSATNPLQSHKYKCWICGSNRLEVAKPSNIERHLSSEAFAITDSKYGATGELHLCKDCGFMQCSDMNDVLPFYEVLQDPAYEATRKARALQSKMLLKVIKRYCSTGRLLDIGAASGILVEQAINMGYAAEGVEPSKWLHSKAEEHGLPVYLGIFPHPELKGPYEVITIIDVLEHISDPLALLFNIHKVIAENGIVVVVTPDISSLAVRILGWKWWHFRAAHIGFFNKKTLEMAFNKAGFRLIRMYRPGWFFTADYIIERINTYMPRALQIPVPFLLKRITLPLNLRDSIMGVFTPLKKENDEH